MPLIDHRRLTVTIDMKDQLDNYREEDIAKDCLPYLAAFLTRRRGVNTGKMILEEGTVEINWKYEDLHWADN